MNTSELTCFVLDTSGRVSKAFTTCVLMQRNLCIRLRLMAKRQYTMGTEVCVHAFYFYLFVLFVRVVGGKIRRCSWEYFRNCIEYFLY